jgi:hypothetical protein
MPTVAIAAEYDGYDAEIYRVLLERLLGQPVVQWSTEMRFNGDQSVRKLVKPYLTAAAAQGVQHALVSVDNDGGTRRRTRAMPPGGGAAPLPRPEHEDDHDHGAQAADVKNGCRVCWVLAALPPEWTANGGKRCIVVPVQTIETWLLCIRGDAFKALTPEQEYDPDVLKKRFFDNPMSPEPVQLRLARALAEIRKPGALDILRQRRSFRHFEAQLADWP